MSTIRINQGISGVTYLEQQSQDPALVAPIPSQTPFNFFDTSTYEGTQSVALADGSTLTLPTLSPDEAAQMGTLFGTLTPEQKANVASAGRALASSVTSYLKSDSAALSASNPPKDVVLALTDATTTYAQTAPAKNYDDTVQAVTYMGLLGLQGDMYDFAKVVKAHIDTQRELRTDATELNQAVAEWPAGVATQSFSWTEVDANGQVVRHSNEPLTMEQAKALATKIDGQRQSMSDMNQMEQMQLQDMSQKYQQGFQTISNLLKMEADTVKAIIGNLRA